MRVHTQCQQFVRLYCCICRQSLSHQSIMAGWYMITMCSPYHWFWTSATYMAERTGYRFFR